MSFYTEEELAEIGFKFVGKNVKIAKKASIYNADKIVIGDNTRVDDFCVLSAGIGGIEIGKYVHIAVYSSIIGAGFVKIDNYANISSKVSIYSSNDDYSGEFMTNPTIDKKFTNVKSENVYIGKHVIVGSGTIILPGITLQEGVSIGALSLVTKNCEAFKIYAGVPVKYIKERKKNLLDLEKKHEDDICDSFKKEK